MPLKPKDLAWQVSVQDSYGTRFVVAQIVSPQENGELHTPDDDRWDTGPGYADFIVRCYLGEPSFMSGSDREARLWGLSHGFRDIHMIESVEHAKRIAATMSKVERGLKKAQEESGYVRDGDYLAYLTRIAGALGIRTYYVRNQKRALDMHGDRYRKVTAENLQYWLSDVVDIVNNRRTDLVLGG